MVDFRFLTLPHKIEFFRKWRHKWRHRFYYILDTSKTKLLLAYVTPDMYQSRGGALKSLKYGKIDFSKV